MHRSDLGPNLALLLAFLAVNVGVSRTRRVRRRVLVVPAAPRSDIEVCALIFDGRVELGLATTFAQAVLHLLVLGL